MLNDLQRQLDELSVKFEWQEKHESLTIDEKIKELEKLINTLDEDKAYPYVNLYKSYKRFKRWGIKIK